MQGNSLFSFGYNYNKQFQCIPKVRMCPTSRPTSCRKVGRHHAANLTDRGDEMKRYLITILISLLPSLCFGGWLYGEKADSMRNKTVYFAAVKSDTLLQFSFPYQGGASASLHLRKNAGEKTDVYVEVDKGQFVTPLIHAKFDDGPILTYRIVYPTDGSTNVVFLSPSETFIQNLRKSKRLMMEITFYNEGSHQLAFDIVGLNWK